MTLELNTPSGPGPGAPAGPGPDQSPAPGPGQTPDPAPIPQGPLIQRGSFLWKAFLILVLFLIQYVAFKLQGADLTRLISGQSVSINQTTAVNIIASLQGATTVQCYIKGSSTAQIFTLTLTDGSTIEVPSGATFTFRSAVPLNATDIVYTAKTATSSAVLQVVSIREIKE